MMKSAKTLAAVAVALLARAAWAPSLAQAVASDGYLTAPPAHAPVLGDGLDYWSPHGIWGLHPDLAPLPPAGHDPIVARLQPSDDHLYGPDSSSGGDLTFVGRHSIFEPPARLSTSLIPPAAYEPLVTIETSSIVSPTYARQFWKGWAFITSVELSILTVTMLVPKDWTGWHDNFIQDGLSNIERAWTSPPVMDDDHWFHNYVGHPYGGNVYYNTVRSQGATPAESFFFSALLSAQWEYAFEAVAEQPSIQDLIITPVTGSILGEAVHRLTLRLKKNGTNLAEKVVITVLNPTHVIMEGYR